MTRPANVLDQTQLNADAVDQLEEIAAAADRAANPEKRLLLVAYNFPPVGGAGVQRPVKWVKYLHRLGWQVTVLTTANPSVPARDESLLADLPRECTILRARTWEPSYAAKQRLMAADGTSTKSRPSLMRRMLSAIKGMVRSLARFVLQPDPQVLWVTNALRLAIAEQRQRPATAVLVTAPPYSSFYIGTALRRRFGIPVILDYRDEWDLSSKYLENAHRDWFSGFIQERMQRWLLRRADAVIATTPASVTRLEERLRAVRNPATTRCIYNGYDADDFLATAEPAATAAVSPLTTDDHRRFRLVYTGTLWKLTDITPLVSAIEQLGRTAPALLERLELVCVGRKTPEQVEALQRLSAWPCRVQLVDYCPHSEVLAWQRSASALLLLLAGVPGAERVVPAKLFEYLASRQEVLGILPAGVTAEILRDYWPAGHCSPDNLSGLADWLQERLARWSPDGQNRPPQIARDDYQQYSREAQTERLAGLLDELTATPRRSSRVKG